MTKLKLIAFSLLISLVTAAAVAQEQADTSVPLDQRIESAIQPVTSAVTNAVFFSVPVNGQNLPLVVVWLIIAAAFFTFYFGFINFRAFRHGFDLVKGKFTDPTADGQVTHFQALSTALSGTVGLGNIAGVAIAVSIGGPGATFWMILAGLLGMSSKFVECTLGVKYRNVLPDGRISGGPMYYLSKGLAEKSSRLAGLGKGLAIAFAICCMGGALGGGNMFQVNQSLQQVIEVTGGESSVFYGNGWLFGLIVAVLVGMVIIGGIRSIAKVTARVVPFMALVYLLAGMAVILMNIGEVSNAFGQIISGAFAPTAVTGGIIGVLIVGFQRAAFSNEAGIGSASIAHAAVKTKEPITEGIVALYEPFVDTVVICTITALVIIITDSYDPTGTISGVELTSAAYATVISWFPYVLALAVVLFAFSTMLSWSYYGVKAWTYLVGEGKGKEIGFKLVFLVFVVIGASMNLSNVIGFSDAMIFAMSVPNVIGLYILAPLVKRELNDYWGRLKAGALPRFDRTSP